MNFSSFLFCYDILKVLGRGFIRDIHHISGFISTKAHVPPLATGKCLSIIHCLYDTRCEWIASISNHPIDISQTPTVPPPILPTPYGRHSNFSWKDQFVVHYCHVCRRLLWGFIGSKIQKKMFNKVTKADRAATFSVRIKMFNIIQMSVCLSVKWQLKQLTLNRVSAKGGIHIQKLNFNKTAD